MAERLETVPLSAGCKNDRSLDSFAALAAVRGVCEGHQYADDHLGRAGRRVMRDPSAKPRG